MRKLRLYVGAVHHKCVVSIGDWDGTWDESYEYIIFDEEGLEKSGMDGFGSREEARKEGEKKLKEMEQ